MPPITLVGAGRVGGSLARRFAPPASTSRLLRPRRGRRRAPTPRSSCSASPTARSRAPARRRPRAAPRPPLRRPHERRDGPRRPRGRRRGRRDAFSLHPLQTIPDGETDLTGAPARDRRLDARPLVLARRDRDAPAGCALRRPRGVARRLPRGRRDRLQLPRRARGERRGAARARPGSRTARELLAPLVLRTAANWAERGPRRLTGPIARGDEETVRPHLEAIAAADPELLPLYEALAERTREIAAAGGAAMRIVETKRELREALAPDRAARSGRSASCPTMGYLHDGHVALLGGRAARLRRRRHEPVRQPGPVRARRGPRGLPARRRPRRGDRRRGRRRPRLRPRGRGGLPEGFATAVEVEGADRGPLRRPGAARARSTSAASRPSSRSCSTSSAPTSPTSARRTPSRRSSSAAWSPTSTSRSRSRSCRPSASPTGSRCPRGTSTSRPPIASRAVALHRALERPRRLRPARARPVDAGSGGSPRGARRRRDRARVPRGPRRRGPRADRELQRAAGADRRRRAGRQAPG